MVLGPTAGGKSDLAVLLAERLDGEIVGADAFQVYRRLDAGTAKPDRRLRERARHHLIDVTDPTTSFSVHDWLTLAHEAIDAIRSRGKRPIVVGGTNLYMKALLDGMFEGPGRDMDFRRSLDGVDTPLLHARLIEIDVEAAGRLKPMDRQRIVRALEVYELTGKPISALQTQWDDDGSEGLDAVLVGLKWEAEAINPRINRRVKAMFYPEKVEEELAASVCINGESLVDEAERLRGEGCFDPVRIHDECEGPNQAREALGYKQLLAWMEGDEAIRSLEDAFEKTKVLTRRFAKQQRTWLKRFTSTHWIEGESYAAQPGAAIDRVEALLRDA